MKLKIFTETMVDNFPEIVEYLISQFSDSSQIHPEDVEYFTVRNALGISMIAIEARYKNEVATYPVDDEELQADLSGTIEVSLEDFLNTLPDGVVSRSINGEVIRVNSRIARPTNQAAQQPTGKKFWE